MTSPDPSAPPGLGAFDRMYEKRAVLLLGLAFGMVGLDRWIIAPLAPAIIADLGFAPDQMNLVIAVLGITGGLSAMLMGSLSDRIGRRKVLLPAILAFSLASGFSALAAGLFTLVLIRGAMGVFAGAFVPASFAATAEASRPERRGLNQGLQQACFPLLGLGLGPILATQLLTVMNWRAVFLIVAIPGLVLTWFLMKTIREPAGIAERRAAGQVKVPLRIVFAHRNVTLAMLGLLCAMCGVFVLGANIPFYLTTSLGLSPTDMGLVTSAIGFGGFVGQLILPWLSDHLGRRPVAILAFSAAALFLMGFINTGPSIAMLFAMLFLCTLFSFGLLALLTGPITTEAAPDGMVSTASGLIIGVGEIFGGGLALVVAGLVIGLFGIGAMLYLALGGLVIGAMLMLFLKETAPRRLAAAVA